jgi:hypothetical protein
VDQAPGERQVAFQVDVRKAQVPGTCPQGDERMTDSSPLAASSADSGQLRVGTAKVDITSPEGALPPSWPDR